MRLRHGNSGKRHIFRCEELQVVSRDENMGVGRVRFPCFEDEDRLVRESVRETRSNQAPCSASADNNVIVRGHSYERVETGEGEMQKGTGIDRL